MDREMLAHYFKIESPTELAILENKYKEEYEALKKHCDDSDLSFATQVLLNLEERLRRENG